MKINNYMNNYIIYIIIYNNYNLYENKTLEKLRINFNWFTLNDLKEDSLLSKININLLFEQSVARYMSISYEWIIK